MSFLLDTNIVSDYLKRPARLSHRFVQNAGRLYLPTIVLAELHVAAHRHPDPGPMLSALSTLTRDEVVVLDYDTACAEVFGVVRAAGLARGAIVPVVDLLIASVALTHDLTLVTDNTKHFVRVPGLRQVNWPLP